MKRLRHTHFLLVAGIAAGGCALGSFRRGNNNSSQGGASNSQGGAGGTMSSSPTTSTTSSAGGSAVCDRATYPAKPQVNGGGDEEFVVAVSQLYLSTSAFEKKFGMPLGLDLDGVCTCTGNAGGSCIPPTSEPCDLDGGRDNSMSEFVPTLNLLLPGSDAGVFYSSGINDGGWSLLIRVSGYNGAEDDDNVTVATYVASNRSSPPKWDGMDAWPVSATSVLNNDIDQPIYVDNNGYVNKNQLVASLPTAEMVVAGSSSTLTFRITGGGILAPLTKGEQGWEVNGGMLLGRLKESDLFYALSSYRDEDGEGFCISNSIYPTAKKLLCEGRDIQTEVVGPTAPCNANSFAAGFDARPAMIGAVTPTPPAASGCSPEDNPANDSCGN